MRTLPVDDESALVVRNQVFSRFGSGRISDGRLLLHRPGKLALQHAFRAQSALRVEMNADGDLSIVACWVLERERKESESESVRVRECESESERE